MGKVWRGEIILQSEGGEQAQMRQKPVPLYIHKLLLKFSLSRGFKRKVVIKPIDISDQPYKFLVMITLPSHRDITFTFTPVDARLRNCRDALLLAKLYPCRIVRTPSQGEVHEAILPVMNFPGKNVFRNKAVTLKTHFIVDKR